MAEPRLFRGWTARALVMKALAALLLLQSFALSGAGVSRPAADGAAAVCHAETIGRDAPAHPGPTPGHCAACLCLHAVEAPPPAVAATDAFAPLADAAPERATRGAAPLPPAGRAGAWSSRAPPRA
jgi:hypothetical protein